MSGKSPNFLPSPRFSNGTPSRNQQFNQRQPLYLPPNSPFMSPRRNQTPSPRGRPSAGSPDFIPLGISSPVNRPRQSWNRGNYSNNSSYSTYSTSSTPSSFNSSHGYSPYIKHGSRGNFRGRGSHNHSGNNNGSGSPPIHLYYDKTALEDPWAELAEKLEKEHGGSEAGRVVTGTEEIVLLESSGSDASDDGD